MRINGASEAPQPKQIESHQAPRKQANNKQVINEDQEVNMAGFDSVNFKKTISEVEDQLRLATTPFEKKTSKFEQSY